MPRNAKEVRRFLGLCTYYRRFIRSFPDVARPLHELTEKGQSFEWTKACEESFEQLKDALVSAPVLAYPRTTEPFLLDTDASNVGVGAVLSQVHDGEEKVIAYYSHALSRPERNYCTTRRELLVVVRAIENFHPYLYGRPFTVRTDHASLQWLLTFKNPEGQMARWLEKLQTYVFRIKYRAGKGHQNADVLSRRPCFEANCTHCKRQEEKELPGDGKGSRPAYSCKRAALEVCHHWARRIEGRGTVRKPTDSGNMFILIAMDYFSKWPEVYALSNQEAVTVANVLVSQFFSRFGVPAELHSDQGRNFESLVFREVCTLLGIHKTRTTALHPQSDGMVERYNRTLENQLATFVQDHQKDWDLHLPLLLMSYHSAVHKTMKLTPAMLMFGRELRVPLDLLLGRPHDDIEELSYLEYAERLRASMATVHDFAQDHQQAGSERMKRRYDIRSEAFTFRKGRLVWLYNP